MPRKQVPASPQTVAALLREWERVDRAAARERGHWRTQMNREAKRTAQAVKGSAAAQSVKAALDDSTIERELRWVQTDLDTDLQRVNELRRLSAPSEHVLAYERRIAVRRMELSRLLTQVA